jgi:hypothetical protein
VHTGLRYGNLKVRDHLKDLGVRCKYNIKIDLDGVGMEGVKWIHQAQDRGKWQVAVNTLMNHRGYYITGNILAG